MNGKPTAFIGKDGWIYLSKKKISFSEQLNIKSKLSSITPYNGDDRFRKESFNLFRVSKKYMILPRGYGYNVLCRNKLNINNNSIRRGSPFLNKYLEKHKLYSYQLSAKEKILTKYSRMLIPFGGILKLPTGKGKTITSIYIANSIGKKTLIVVNTIPLANQWMEEIKNVLVGDVKICILSSFKNPADGRKAIANNDFIICVCNTLTWKYNWKDFISIETVIVDEIHSVISENIIKMFNSISRFFILGITATPTLFNNLHFLMKYYIGPTLYNYEDDYKGVTPDVTFINYMATSPWNKIFYRKGNKMDYTRTLNNIMNDPKRMKICVSTIKLLMKDKGIKRIIVMAMRRKTIEQLKEEIGTDSGIFYSVNTKKDKEMVTKTLQDKKVILAVNALGEQSLNIKECNCLVLLNPPILRKSANGDYDCSRLTQTVGRCLRKNWSREFKPKIIVFNDMFSMFAGHMKLRKIFFKTIKKWNVSYVHVGGNRKLSTYNDPVYET
jgi:superfamily II DNA or RNA helicase